MLRDVTGDIKRGLPIDARHLIIGDVRYRLTVPLSDLSVRLGEPTYIVFAPCEQSPNRCGSCGPDDRHTVRVRSWEEAVERGLFVPDPAAGTPS